MHVIRKRRIFGVLDNNEDGVCGRGKHKKVDRKICFSSFRQATRRQFSVTVVCTYLQCGREEPDSPAPRAYPFLHTPCSLSSLSLSSEQLLAFSWPPSLKTIHNAQVQRSFSTGLVQGRPADRTHRPTAAAKKKKHRSARPPQHPQTNKKTSRAKKTLWSCLSG